MLYQVTHRTTYGYGTNVSVSHHLARLQPRELPCQRVSNFLLSIDPLPVIQTGRVDFFARLRDHSDWVGTGRATTRDARPGSRRLTVSQTDR